MKKILTLILFALTGCQIVPTSPDYAQNQLGDLFDNSGSDYVSELTTDPDGFVRFPGEPTRESKDYYIIEDICGQFTAEFIEGITGREVVNAENPLSDTNIYTCHYTFAGEDSAGLLLVLDYLSIENQKKGQEMMDRTTKEEPSIPMRNMVAYQEDGNINTIYLILDDNKFITVHRGSGSKLSNEDVLGYAVKIAQKIKNYK